MAIQFLNNVNADSGVLYVDAVNDRVGVGTTTPKQLFHVHGGSTSGSVTKAVIGGTGGNGESYLYLAENFQGNDVHFGFSFVADGNSSNNLLIKRHSNSTSGNTVITVNRDNDNVTFGGTVYIPSKLEHTGDSNTFLNFSDDTITLSAGGSTATIAGNGTATFAGKIIAEKGVQFTGGTIAAATTVLHTNNVVYTRGGSSGMFLQNADGSDGIFIANDHIRVETGTAERIRITSGGNVGIGTTSPDAPLHIKSTNFEMLKLEQNDANGGLIRFLNTDDTDGWFTGIAGTEKFIISRTADNTSPIITVEQNGDVGIGTDSPSEKLDVNGTVNLTNLKIATAQGSDGQVLTSTGSGIAWEDVSGGLPTTGGTMTGDLRFNDNVYARFGSTGTGDLVIGHVDFGSPYSTILENGSGDLKIQATNLLLESANGETYVDCNFNSSVDLYYNNSKKFETTSAGVSTTGDSIITGDVGIGTTSPSAKLHVNGQNGLIVGDGNETGLSINNGSYIYKIGDIDGGENQSFIEIDSANQKTIFNNTNVGIGTTSPDGFLHIDGMNSSTAAIVVEAAGSGDNVIMEMQNNGAAKRMTLQYDNSNINFNITDRNDDPIITFRESGNIGIGLETPSSALEMSGSLDNTSSKLLRLTRSNQGSSPAKAVGFYSNNGERGSITVSNFATAYNTSSDYRLKENVVPIEDGINRLMSLKPCRFNFVSEEQVVDGFLAHEAQSIVPEAISGEKDQIDEDGNEVYQGIDQAKLVPLLTAALQEAIKRIEILEQKNK